MASAHRDTPVHYCPNRTVRTGLLFFNRCTLRSSQCSSSFVRPWRRKPATEKIPLSRGSLSREHRKSFARANHSHRQSTRFTHKVGPQVTLHNTLLQALIDHEYSSHSKDSAALHLDKLTGCPFAEHIDMLLFASLSGAPIDLPATSRPIARATAEPIVFPDCVGRRLPDRLIGLPCVRARSVQCPRGTPRPYRSRPAIVPVTTSILVWRALRLQIGVSPTEI